MFDSSMFSTGNQALSKERKPIFNPKSRPTEKRQGSRQEKDVKKRIQSGLSGSKFRMLNEFLYTSESDEAVKYLQQNRNLFDDYHEGFAKQTEDWPVRPVDVVIQELSKFKAYNNNIVIDLGCGEGLIYEYFQNKNRIGNNSAQDDLKQHNIFKKILSYDLVSTKDFIKECDIKNLPLDSQSVDAAIFCLALMGKNYIEFIMEAQRVLKVGGRLLVAEVLSRFSDLRVFVILVKKLGFKFVKYVKKNSYFVLLIFKKIQARTSIRDINQVADVKTPGYKAKVYLKDLTFKQLSQKVLQPCIYKKR